MKFGVHAFIWTATFDRSNLDLLPPIKEHGFDGVEIPLFQPRDFDAVEIRRGFERYGLECTVSEVLVDGLNAISGDAEVRRKTATHLQDSVKAVAEAGARLLVGPLYAPVGYLPGRRRTEEEWRWAADCFQQVAPVAAEYGVTLALEPLNRFETYFLNTAADAVALAAAVGHPNVGVLLDTFHLNIEEKDIAAAYRMAGSCLKHVHTCENDRGIPGSGHVEWPSVFQALRDVDYDGWLTIESFGFSIGGISAAASIWRDLAPTPDAIAFEGVQFLKRNARPAGEDAPAR